MVRLVLLALALAAGESPARDRAADPQVRRALDALRNDGSLKVRTQAAFVLAQRGAREAIPALRRALAEDEAGAVRVAVAAALGRIGGPGVAAVLRDASAHDRDGAVRSAAAQALDAIVRGARTVSVEAVRGEKGDPDARRRLHGALTDQLQQHGFDVVDVEAEAGYRLKPSMLLFEQAQSGNGMTVEVKASVIAVDGTGGIAAIVEGGARARTAASAQAAPRLTGQALEAAARSISEDLARRLLELP
jgi:HEAT repeat protein